MTADSSKWMNVSVFATALFVCGSSSAVAQNDGSLGSCEGRNVSIPWFSKYRLGTINDTMQSWVGSPLSELVARWGAPDSTFENRDGSRIITWKESDWIHGECSKNFEVDAQDVLTRWNTRGPCGCTYDDKASRESKDVPVPRMTL